jgi:acyl-CoA thioesterase I
VRELTWGRCVGEVRMRWSRSSSAIAGSALVAALVPTLRARRHAHDTVRRPCAIAAEGRRPDTSTLVVCVGDSLTAGQLSADWVALLAEGLGPRGYEFVNAGVNSQLAWNVLQRLDEVIACDPDIVTLLVGSNDVLATLSPGHAARYRRYQRLPQRPTFAWYRENVERILDRLATETRARLVVLELPLLGEDRDSEPNRRVERYNLALRELCEQRGVACLPLHRRLADLLPAEHRAPPGAGSTGPMAAAAARRLLLRQDWDTISAKHGLRLLTDHVHLNGTAATVVADLLTDALTSEEPGPARPMDRSGPAHRADATRHDPPSRGRRPPATG